MQGAPLQSVLVTAQGKGSVMAPSSDLRRVLQRWAGVARLWWRCPSERRRAWAFVAACVALSITNVGLLLWISYVQNALQTSLSEKQQGERAARGCRRRRHGPPTPRHTLPIAPCDSIPPPRCLTCTPARAAGFHAAVWDFVLIIVVAAPLFALTDYVDSCLTVAWRKWLTQHMIRCAPHARGRCTRGKLLPCWRHKAGTGWHVCRRRTPCVPGPLPRPQPPHRAPALAPPAVPTLPATPTSA